METELIKPILDLGAIGAIALILLLKQFASEKKLFSVIENNTAAMQKLADKIDGCPVRDK
jgi:hypothetical protein